MRAAMFIACCILAGLGVLAAGGLSRAQTLPVPTVTLPVTAPSLTVPSVTVTDVLTTPSVTTPDVSSTGGGLGGNAGTLSGLGAATAPAVVAGEEGRGEPARPRLSNLRVRPWRFKNRPRNAESTGTTFRFRLSESATVTFRIRLESPECRAEGQFSAVGQAGPNIVPFSGWLGGDPLPPGSYTVRARAVRDSLRSAEQSALFVVVAHGEEVAAARPASSRCGGTGRHGEPGAELSGSPTGSAGGGGALVGDPAPGPVGIFAPPTISDISQGDGGQEGQEAAGVDRGGFPGSLPEPSRSQALIVAAVLLLAAFALGNLAYALWLRRNAPLARRRT